uniref:Uncharacterized protein n=1 Tax=Caudovirales sp. ctikv1 TaxID=2826781 RepID=A0A8S5N2K4_9CAUD|nr:MAG TPA: hypothetical protein [Caudovirales sp. ctikv1]
MDMHKKIIAFAVSLETDVLNGNHLYNHLERR